MIPAETLPLLLPEDPMKKLHLAPHFSLPQKIVTEKIAILGATGSGKTTTASVLVEELLRLELPVEIIDPTDAWWGLRSSKDGKAAAYPVTVLGGDHGDLPLEETAGHLIADLIAEKAPPLVISLAHFSKSAMRRFMADFAERLYQKNRRAVHLILDEADESAPQNPAKMKGGERLYGAIDTIVRRGRIRGLGVTMISQRSAEISKSILSQCSVLVAHRASHPTDLDPIFDWMKFNARDRLEEVKQTIAQLKNGEAWVMSPELLKVFARVQIRDRETFNSSATPEPGVARIVPKKLAAVDLEALQERMKDTIERAAANDPAMLRRQVADANARAAKAQQIAAELADRAANPPAKLTPVEVPVVKDATVKRIEAAIEKAARTAEALTAFGAALRAQLAEARKEGTSSAAVPMVRGASPGVQQVENIRSLTRLADSVSRAHSASRHLSQQAAALAAYAAPDLAPDLPPAAQRMLDAIARCHPTAVTRSQLAILAGYSPTGGGFRNTLSSLRVAGLIAERGTEEVALSDAGVARYGARLPPPLTPSETRAMWQQKLSPAAWRMLEVILERREVSRADLAAATDYELSGGGFRNTLSTLSSAGLILKNGATVLPHPTLLGE